MFKPLILTVLSLSAAAFAQTGGLTVSVQDPSGKAITGARVAITSLPVYVPSATGVSPSATSVLLPHYNGSATTGSNGTAIFSSVPTGVYALCAYPTGQQVVDSCSWVIRPQSAVVTASATASYTVQLKQAARVTVLVNDSQQILATAAAPGRHLQLGVTVPQDHWQPLRTDAATATSQSLSILVPVNTDLKLAVGAYGLKVTGTSGNLLRSNNPQESVPFNVPASGTVPTLQLNVVGTL
jgi:hypothetical protein